MKLISNLTEIESVRRYLARIEAEPRSLRTAVVKEERGRYWKDIAVIKFDSSTGEVSVDKQEYAPTPNEQDAIKAEWATVEIPRCVSIPFIIDPPPMMANANKKDVFVFKDVADKLVLMVQVRVEHENGKSYYPWTYWSDNRWRQCEPDKDLPLWGLEQLKHNRIVFIHEGAKAAAYCRWLAEGESREAREACAAHPWGDQLQHAAHLGWIGGALNPSRTDWSPLIKRGVERVYIVADNDPAGKSAITKIAKRVRATTLSVEFNDRFPYAFDLGDAFPASMFESVGGQKFYVGPSMRDLMAPATWATDQIQNPSGQGRPVNVLREPFRQMWAYVEEADAFVCTEMPEILRSEPIFNKMTAAFSDVKETSTLLVKSYKGRSAKLCYRPDQQARLVDYRGANAINLHVPSSVRGVKGDPEPWLEFLRYMFVNDSERKQVERWCATLIARPEIRMGYGLLLISETQGVGKTTLGAVVLAPLVGQHNVGYPSENDITSNFNDWVAHKRLAIVNEIYSGSSWKAYHALKSIITDSEVSVNQKYMRQYVVDNWCHILACSNSMRALKMEMDDRRWFYPEVTEVPWEGEKFVAFRKWVQGGGLSIIRWWAEQYGDYVGQAERAPMTERKRELIEGSRSEAQREAVALAEQLKDLGRPGALMIKDVIGWVRDSIQGKMFDSDYEIRRAMTESGIRPWGRRLKIGGRLQYAMLNEALYDLCQRAEDPLALIRQHVVKPQDLMESTL